MKIQLILITCLVLSLADLFSKYIVTSLVCTVGSKLFFQSILEQKFQQGPEGRFKLFALVGFKCTVLNRNSKKTFESKKN